MRPQRNKKLEAELEAHIASEAAYPKPPGWEYANPADFVWKNATSFSPYQAYGFGYGSGPENQCYNNAAWLVINDDRFGYVEGYATGESGQSCPRAWATDFKGRVYDPSWPKPGLAYRGVLFRTEYLIGMFADAPSWMPLGLIGQGVHRLVSGLGALKTEWGMSLDDIPRRPEGKNRAAFFDALPAAMTRAAQPLERKPEFEFDLFE